MGGQFWPARVAQFDGRIEACDDEVDESDALHARPLVFRDEPASSAGEQGTIVTIRRQVRGALDHGARWLGVLRRYERRMNEGVTVLMYHRILAANQCATYPFPALVMSERMFAEQVAWLSKYAEVLPVVQALAASPRPRQRPLVAITFDDGYWDNFEIAAPILEQHGVRATFFVTSGFLQSGELLWFDRAFAALRDAEDSVIEAAASAQAIAPPRSSEFERGRIRAWIESLKRTAPDRRSAFLTAIAADQKQRELNALYRPMRPEQLAELCRRGHEVGSHSARHEILPLLADDALDLELYSSREQLAGWSGACVSGFCYPNGAFDARVVAATRRAGYQYACTTQAPKQRHSFDPLQLGRFDITSERVTRSSGDFDLIAFRAEVCGLRQAWR